MRVVKKQQMELGQARIESIRFNPKSRDDVPAILRGLQHLYLDPELRSKLFELLQQEVVPERSHAVGRPGMELWNILVLAVLKQGLGCDFDRLQELANEHRTLRQMLGHGAWVEQHHRYQVQTLIDNVSLLSVELLAKIGQLVIESGHEVARKKPGAPLRGRCDSFVVETDVHHPTDVNLLWDALRCLIRSSADAAVRYEITGWRQHHHILRKVRRLFERVSNARQWRQRSRVADYLKCCAAVMEQAEDALRQLRGCGANTVLAEVAIERWLQCAQCLSDQVRRRLLNGETIPHEEKVFSLFETHTRWISKGKAGVPVELGVPVCIVEDQFQFILHHEILWQGSDVDVAVPLIEHTQRRFAAFRMCSFDRGFHSPENRRQLDRKLDVNALPRKGRLSLADQQRESADEFVKARRQHPAVESAINNLEHRGLGRVRSRGPHGFARTVALSVLAANIHRLGRLLQKRERDQQRRHKLRQRAA